MVRYILTLVLFLFCACANKESSLSEEEKLGYKAISDFGKKIRDKKLMGIGCAFEGDKIRMLDVTFGSDIELTIPTAREIIVKLVDDFLKEINENEKLKPCLSDYPFTDKNINMCVFGKRVKGNDELLFSVSSRNSYVAYRKDNPNGGLLLTILEETYDEAERKLMETEK